MSIRRTRGRLLRVALDRPAAALGAVATGVPAAVLILGDAEWESAATDGLALLLVSLSVALLVMAVGGRRPDWIEPPSNDPRG